MTKKYGKKFGLTREDQAQLYFEAFFVMAIQSMMCACVWYSLLFDEEHKTPIRYYDDWKMNLCCCLANLVLHFSSVSTVRNGLMMMKYSLYHPEELDNPSAVYFLGLATLLTNIMVALTNQYSTLTQNNVVNQISKFISYRIIMAI